MSDAAGHVELAYDASAWLPAFVAVEPAVGYWTLAAAMPQSGQALQLQELADNGPLQWWQLVCGAGTGSSAGRGIRIGAADTGIGPHPALAHAVGLGAIMVGSFVAGAQVALDSQSHGTHVSGIIGAAAIAAADGAPSLLGLAHAAHLMMVRIFGEHCRGN